MNSVTTSLAVSAVLAFLPACGAGPETTPPPSPNVTSESALRAADVEEHPGRGHDDCLGRADFDGVSAKVEAELNFARRAVCRFRRLDCLRRGDHGHVASTKRTGMIWRPAPCAHGEFEALHFCPS